MAQGDQPKTDGTNVTPGEWATYLQVPDPFPEIAELRKRIEELERRPVYIPYCPPYQPPWPQPYYPVTFGTIHTGGNT